LGGRADPASTVTRKTRKTRLQQKL